MPRYLVTVNDREYDIELNFTSAVPFSISVNGKKKEITRHELQDSRALLLIEQEAFEVDVRSNGFDTKRSVLMKGLEIEAEIEDYSLAQLRKTAGMAGSGAVERVIKAPMPGLVLDVKVSPGQQVKKGEPVLIIEAMKMENVLKAPADGAVKVVHVASGQSVEKSDKLLEFE